MKNSHLNDNFFKDLEKSVLGIDQAETLPPLCYTDTEFYEFEKEAVFNHEWLCVGRESWVSEPGDYFTSSIIGEPILITRNRDGALKAMSSVCQHRAMIVAEGSGNARGFVCPYHHWTFSLDGDLVKAPAMDKTCDFDRSKHNLPALKLEVWLGFIFINFDLEAPPLAPRLEAVTAMLKTRDIANLEGPRPEPAAQYGWNWKVMLENNNDGYHASRLHQGPLHDFVPSGMASFPSDLPADSAGYYRHNGTKHRDASFNATQKAVFPIFPNLTEEDRNQVVFANLPPTLSIVGTSDEVIYLILRASGPESLEMDIGLLAAPGAMAEPSFDLKVAMNMAAVGIIVDQDWHVDELVQVGLRSRFAVRGRYSWQEGAQSALNKWLVPRYQACWERLRD
jgi:phenylpropionate dioxygenase-like ring-hydroxylating dioxygenase large terminal subunit